MKNELDRMTNLRRKTEGSSQKMYDEKLAKISNGLHDAERHFENKIEEYIRKSAKKWKKISLILSHFPEADLKKLDIVTPNTEYLAKFRLLSVTGRKPEPGDVFLDLNADDHPRFVYSPENLTEFRRWRNIKGHKRSDSVAGVSVRSLLRLGKVRDFTILDPTVFITNCENAMKLSLNRPVYDRTK
jgi:hypothetical protein